MSNTIKFTAKYNSDKEALKALVAKIAEQSSKVADIIKGKIDDHVGWWLDDVQPLQLTPVILEYHRSGLYTVIDSDTNDHIYGVVFVHFDAFIVIGNTMMIVPVGTDVERMDNALKTLGVNREKFRLAPKYIYGARKRQRNEQ